MKKSINDIVEEFKSTHRDSINYGKTRNNCGVVASDFMIFANKKGFDVKRVFGTFKVDNLNSLSVKDFTNRELKDMKSLGYSESYDDLLAYATEKDLLDELKEIPHYWNEYDGEIIDLSAEYQFVKTGLASDTDSSRYSK